MSFSCVSLSRGSASACFTGVMFPPCWVTSASRAQAGAGSRVSDAVLPTSLGDCTLAGAAQRVVPEQGQGPGAVEEGLAVGAAGQRGRCLVPGMGRACS